MITGRVTRHNRLYCIMYTWIDKQIEKQRASHVNGGAAKGG